MNLYFADTVTPYSENQYHFPLISSFKVKIHRFDHVLQHSEPNSSSKINRKKETVLGHTLIPKRHERRINRGSLWACLNLKGRSDFHARVRVSASACLPRPHEMSCSLLCHCFRLLLLLLILSPAVSLSSQGMLTTVA